MLLLLLGVTCTASWRAAGPCRARAGRGHFGKLTEQRPQAAWARNPALQRLTCPPGAVLECPVQHGVGAWKGTLDLPLRPPDQLQST